MRNTELFWVCRTEILVMKVILRSEGPKMANVICWTHIGMRAAFPMDLGFENGTASGKETSVQIPVNQGPRDLSFR